MRMVREYLNQWSMEQWTRNQRTISNRWKLEQFFGTLEFRHLDYVMQQNNMCCTCCGNVFSSRFRKPSKKFCKMKLNHLDYLMRGKCEESVCRQHYLETIVKLNSLNKKECQKLELELQAASLEFQNIPRTWIQIQVFRQKTNIISGCPRHLDIQKELGWNLVVWGDFCRRLLQRVWVVAGLVFENVINSVSEKLMYCPGTV